MYFPALVVIAESPSALPVFAALQEFVHGLAQGGFGQGFAGFEGQGRDQPVVEAWQGVQALVVVQEA